MPRYYHRGVDYNPFNLSIISAGYLGTTEPNIFSVCSVFVILLLSRSRLLSFMKGGGGGVCEIFKTRWQSINSIIYCALFTQPQAL